MKILNYGSVNIDFVYSVPRIVSPGETLAASALDVFSGGKGANQSTALARAGLDVFHAGRIGEDGLWILKELEASGVDTRFITRGKERTGNALIQVSADGENSIILYGGGNRSIGREEIERVFENFGPGDSLVVQNEINLIPAILEKAAERGMRIHANPAPFSDDVLAWPLHLLDTLVVNELEGAALSGIDEKNEEKILKALSNRFPQTEIVLTVGKDGAWYAGGDELFHVPVVETKTVDTTAAGDTFFGYYLTGRLRGLSALDSMELAARAAAIAVSRPGAAPSIPWARELT